ncbi:MAG: hypothetical protein JXA54_00945 [Candidatus Heimdallarchaeota archaeon]|nr:hypothetical protein [Candidatus Heimdallarchaeota archaeon]
MSENNNTHESNEEQTNELELPVKEKKVNWRSFIKISGFTITFAAISILLIIIGLILFYRADGLLRNNVGFWMILAGVIIFLLTVILGFEKVE